MDKEEHRQQPPSPNLKKEDDGLLVEMKDALLRLELKEKSFITHLRMHHKVTFAFFVFFAINLLWYGMWGIIESIPILKNPMVSLVVGAMILIATGYFYDNLISSSFNKTRRKKKEVENKETKP